MSGFALFGASSFRWPEWRQAPSRRRQRISDVSVSARSPSPSSQLRNNSGQHAGRRAAARFFQKKIGLFSSNADSIATTFRARVNGFGLAAVNCLTASIHGLRPASCWATSRRMATRARRAARIFTSRRPMRTTRRATSGVATDCRWMTRCGRATFARKSRGDFCKTRRPPVKTV